LSGGFFFALLVGAGKGEVVWSYQDHRGALLNMGGAGDVGERGLVFCLSF